MSINYSKRSVDKIPLNIKYLAVPHYSPENCHVVLSAKKKLKEKKEKKKREREKKKEKRSSSFCQR